MVLITIWVELIFLPLASSLLLAVEVFSAVDGAVAPLVLAEATRKSFFVLTRIHISIGEEIRALPMFESVLPLTLILIAVLPLMSSVPHGLIVPPLAHIVIVVNSLPNTVACFAAVGEVAVVGFTI